MAARRWLSIFMWPMTCSVAEARWSSRLMPAEHATLLAGDEDALRPGGIVAAESLLTSARSIVRSVAA
jgi:hypothetical protein